MLQLHRRQQESAAQEAEPVQRPMPLTGRVHRAPSGIRSKRFGLRQIRCRSSPEKPSDLCAPKGIRATQGEENPPPAKAAAARAPRAAKVSVMPPTSVRKS